MNANGKLNILQVHNFYQQPGGEDTVAANEKRLLEQAGHHVITYYRSNAELNELHGIKKFLIPFTAVFSIRTYCDIKRLIKEQSVDLVHIHNTHMRISPSVFYAARKMGVPAVQTLHNFRLACPAGVFYRDGHICEECLQKGLGCAVEHRCYRGSKAQTIVNAAVTKIHQMLGTYRRAYFICLTEFNRDKLLELNQNGKHILDASRIFIKPNFTFRDEPTAGECGTENMNPAARCFLFVGRLEPMKGINLVVEAFAQMPEMELSVAGDGPLGEELRRYVADNGIRNIHFLGQLDKKMLLEYYRTSAALILASQWYEGFPMVITEAYAHGLPVIAGDIGNLSSLVESGRTGMLYTYDSAEALIKAVRKFDESKHKDMQKNAAAFYEAALSPSGNLAILEQIYQKILER